ncbi:ankyrin repeat domain-containing protein [Rhodanobacter sp. DHB23]|uniref:ankyrin repeat domain-containing protein n=1 Tax=Rhodanobacter sp. DHB23 TaxID=2775923 RepID=UPI0017843C45|nr:ankyrin repeat domain-containing protein [Rhodanobacter sp. DHB23]MBD8874294.1 ankyrin repeat domain-containing protein [Rhodanobacter sp. DHB23]
MTQIKSRRRPPFLQALAWFIPGLLAVALAGTVAHPLTLIPLLLANALTMAAVCHAIGFEPEPSFARTVLRRGAAHLVMLTAYAVIVFVLVAWPMLSLSQSHSLSATLALVATLVLALAVLWRPWPAFGLVFVWDDAYPAKHDGSWIFTATLRSLMFGRHLAREERFFSHFLPAALALLAMTWGAIALSGLYGMLPSEIRIAALALYGVLVLPLGCLIVANRTLRTLLCAQHDRHRRRTEHADAMIAAGSAAPAVAAPLSEQERTAGTPEQAAALLAATRDGDIERALALVEAGADPATAPPAGDRDQRPVLMLAALLPDTRLLRALIAKGADVDRTSGGLTPLLAATRDSLHGRAEAVMTLLANGANPLATDAEGRTALHGAVLCEEPMVAAMLLDAGAPINALDRAGASPLAAACRAANWTLAKFLLERGAKPAPANGEPALVAAAGIADDDTAGVKLLLKHRAAVNAVDARRRSALIAAAAEGHEQIARALCAAGADATLADHHGSTALMEAARAGAVGIVQRLAETQPDARARDGHGRDALTLACQSPRAHADTVRALLALGAEPKTPGSDGRSALDHAAATGRWDLVALLDPETPLPASLGQAVLSSGADTPAHLLDALRFGHWAIVSGFAARVREWPQAQLAQLYLDLAQPGQSQARRWLLDHGLDAEARLAAQQLDDEHGDEDMVADGEGSALPPLGRRLFDALLLQLPAATEAMEDLLQAGATPAGAGLLAQALQRLGGATQGAALPLALLERGADPFGPDARERTPLQLAAANGQIELLQVLLARGGNPNCRDRDGRTPLFAALEHGEAALPMVRLLIAHGADAESADANGETPLGLALEHPVIERWLDWGAWSRPRRPLRADDLPAAAQAGALTAVQRLLELGFAVDTVDAHGASALLHACGAGHAGIAAGLLDAGADPVLTTPNGITPLAAAVAAGRENTAALLLERKAAVDQRLPNQSTALMVAAAMGRAELAEALLAAGADVDAVDAQGHSALHAAAQYGFEHNDSLRARRLLDVLLRHGATVDRADSEGKTALLLLLGASQRPGSECDATHLGALVPVLLEAGADVTHADQRGVTALHACAMHALLAPARVLLSRGADRAAADAFGRTAADVARQLGFVDIAHELAVRTSAIPSVRQTLRQPAQPAE